MVATIDNIAVTKYSGVRGILVVDQGVDAMIALLGTIYETVLLYSVHPHPVYYSPRGLPRFQPR